MLANPIAATEFESRHERVREALRERDLGALFVYSPPVEHKWAQTAHVSYLTGWANHDRIVETTVVVPVTGRPVMMFAGLPYMLEQVAEVSPLEDVRLVQAVDPNAVAVAGKSLSDFAGETLAILEENGLAGKAVGVVGVENMPVPFYEALSKGLGGQLRRVDDIVARLRGVKTPQETELMRRAAQLSDLGFQTMLDVAKPGMRGIEIVAEMERAVRREGADHAKYWMASGPAPDWNDARLDIKPHERVLEHGDLMGACSYVLYKGYWCHGHRAGTLAKPCDELDALCATVRDIQDVGLKKSVPAVSVGDVVRSIREAATEKGLELNGGRVGHGIGMDYSESPGALAESNQLALEPGMTFVMHTAVSLPDTGKLFVPLGDVCSITEDGPEFLMQFPRTPFVAGA